MSVSVVLLSCLLVTVVVTPLLSLLIWQMRRNENTADQWMKLHQLETTRVQTMMNMLLAGNFQTFAGMQQLTNQRQNLLSGSQPNQDPMTLFPNLASEYIPRDDITEAQRIKAFGGTVGYGETVFDEDDPDLAQAISEMIGSGQVMFEDDGEVI